LIDLSIDLGGIRLENPVMPASGTFSDGLANVFDLNLLGAIVLKTVTCELRQGNPLPRVAETPHGLLNSIGIPSRGVSELLEKTIPFYSQFSPPLIVSISAPTPQEFASLAQQVSYTGVAGLEINLSCPNLEADGRSFAMDPSTTFTAVRKIRAATHLPLWIKLSPNAGDVAEVAKAAESAGANAVVVANTILAMAIDIQSFNFRLGNIMGGLSGPAVKPIILRQVYQCARAVKIPVIGCGGISNSDDALEYLLAGASAVQVGTATFLHPNTMPQIIEGLRGFCERRGMASLTSIIGHAHGKASVEVDLISTEACL
jgi:dihydroorotate dehydrogenase (NAD+) catalytic subunit